jgi:hypothetical protein
MDVWEVPQSSCSGLDKGFLMDVRPQQVAQMELGRSVDVTIAPATTTRTHTGGSDRSELRMLDCVRLWIPLDFPELCAFCPLALLSGGLGGGPAGWEGWLERPVRSSSRGKVRCL